MTQIFREKVKPRVESKDGQSFAVLDGDPEIYDRFVAAEPLLTASDVAQVRAFTFNLNPALQSEVLKAVVHKGELEKTPHSVLELDPPLEEDLRTLIGRLPGPFQPDKPAA